MGSGLPIRSARISGERIPAGVRSTMVCLMMLLEIWTNGSINLSGRQPPTSTFISCDSFWVKAPPCPISVASVDSKRYFAICSSVGSDHTSPARRSKASPCRPSAAAVR